MNTKILGNKGEKIAVKLLKKEGYKIRETNFKVKTGEIDIIAEKDKTIVFIEVKTRKKDSIFSYYSVNLEKQRKIERIAVEYLLKYNIKEFDIRFDVILILGEKIKWIKNAYLMEGKIYY